MSICHKVKGQHGGVWTMHSPACECGARIDYDEGGIDDLWIPSHNIRLERMSDGIYWMKVGPHVFTFHTRRKALIRAVHRNEDTGVESGYEARK